jgi:chromosome segregation ATPase
MRRRLVSVSLAVMLLAGVSASSTLARQDRQDPDVLAALLVEVRGLRAAMEQLGAAGPRVQLALGRLQLNEQRITTYLRRLAEVRDRLPDAELAVRQSQKQLAEHTDVMRDAGPPYSAWVTEELKRRQADLADANATLFRLRNEEAKLLQEIATEQDRWAEINQRLEELDRALTRR